MSPDTAAPSDGDDAAQGACSPFAAIMARAGDVLMLVDSGLSITWISDSVERILGARTSGAIGRSLIGFVHPDDVDALHDLVAGLADGPEHRSLRVRVRRDDGSYRWFELSRRDRTSDPRVGGLFLTLRSVTEQEDPSEDFPEDFEALPAAIDDCMQAAERRRK